MAAHGLEEAVKVQSAALDEGEQTWLLVPGGLGTRQLVHDKVTKEGSGTHTDSHNH